MDGGNRLVVAIQRDQQGGAHADGGQQVGIHDKDPFHIFQRRVEVFVLLMNLCAQQSPAQIIRVQLDGPVDIGQCFSQFALQSVDAGPVGVCGTFLGSQFDRLVQLHLGLVQFSSQQQVDSQHFVRLGMLRLDLQGLTKIGQRFFVFVDGHVVQATSAQCLYIVRHQLQRLVQINEFLVVIRLHFAQQGQGVGF